MQNGAQQMHMGPSPLGSRVPAAVQLNRIRTAPRGPGGAVREVDTAPIPPPRPESTLSPRSRPIVPVKKISANIPTVPSLPPRPVPVPLELDMPRRPPSPVQPPLGTISLTSPRPGPNRTQNLYVDAPLRSPTVVKQPLGRAGSFPLPQSASKRVNSKSSPGGSGVVPGSKQRPLLSQQPSVIQPVAPALKKSKDLGTNSSDFEAPVAAESILCRNCNRCRCKACREPRRLPEYYLCQQKCLCSTETVVDTLSGMYLVKALFYHCGKDYSSEEDSFFENPCSCGGEYIAARWGCMAAMSLVMPCLLCYLPLKGCASASQAVYAKCTSTGCRCELSKPVSENIFANVRNNNEDVIVSSPSSGAASPVDSQKGLLSEL